ncbi:glyoxalase family protein [Streptococcus infantis SK1302]|uniref:Glyoxalase family protein n=1 Tax=Streptococcus infantis SK1302 TaxID=871237 RepID=A0ABP2JAD8_9STRE|nr:glyoxalase family protein [Streptococcus infantis SK1302]
MVYQYNSRIHLAEVALNVRDLASQAAFYHQLLGLEILNQSEKEVLLGAGGKPLVKLIQTEDTSNPKQSYDLYHMALLLPSREDLANVFKHLLDLKIPLVGGADHGYSEAIYLEDLEGNGIELYRDKPVVEWDIREDGRIIGVTEELSAQDIYELGKEMEPFAIASGTRIGHVHLSVKNSRKSSAFYQESLNLEDKFTIPHASWIASGDYHHHLAVNEWGGKNLAPREQGMPGLAYYVVEVENKEFLVNLFTQAQDRQGQLQWISSSEFSVTDKDGIVTRVRVEN